MFVCNYHFFFFEIVGNNAKPIPISVSGIYSDGTSTDTVKTKQSGGYLCYNDFTKDEGQVVCLIWGYPP